MSTQQGPVAPESGSEIDPEIADLLTFEPAPRKINKVDGWTPALQRRFIAKLAELGSPAKAADALGRCRYGAEKLYKADGADSFRSAWDQAIEMAQEREAARQEAKRAQWSGVRPPGGADKRMAAPRPGQVMNEQFEWEDPDSFEQRHIDACLHVAERVLRARRLYLAEISQSPGKRAAFEILTEYPIDWDKAARGEAQADEPYKEIPNLRKPHMMLTAESGWLHDWAQGYGPDKMGAMREALNQHLIEMGKEPVDWERESTED